MAEKYRGRTMMGSPFQHKLEREGDRYIVAISADEAAQRGLHEGQDVFIQPAPGIGMPPPPPRHRAPSRGIWGLVETLVDLLASKIALAQYRRYGRAVARDAEDVLSDLGL